MIHSTNVHFQLIVSIILFGTIRVTADSGFRLQDLIPRQLSIVPYPTATTSQEKDKREAFHTYNHEQQKYHPKKDRSRRVLSTVSTDCLWDDDKFDECASLWNLDTEEKNKMHSLQTKLKDIKHWKNDPFEVVRFLRGFNGNVDIAEEKFRKMIKWRMENNVDKILENYTPPDGFDYFPIAVLKGVDRDGDPIHVERTGASDMLEILHRYGDEEMIKHAIWIREQDSRGEWQRQHECEQGHRVKKFTVIMDMQGFSRKHFSPSLMPIGKQVTRFVQDNYPCFAKKIVIVRAPPVFRVAWSAFKPFVDKDTRDLIVFLPPNDHGEVLKQYVDPKVLPSVVCPDGQGEAATGFHPVWEGGPPPAPEGST